MEYQTFLILAGTTALILLLSLLPRGVMYLYNSTEGRVNSFVRRELRRFIVGVVSFVAMIGLIVTTLNTIQ